MNNNNKKRDYRVAKWHQFRENRGSLRAEPRETGNSTRKGNPFPRGRLFSKGSAWVAAEEGSRKN